MDPGRVSHPDQEVLLWKPLQADEDEAGSGKMEAMMRDDNSLSKTVCDEDDDDDDAEGAKARDMKRRVSERRNEQLKCENWVQQLFE